MNPPIDTGSEKNLQKRGLRISSVRVLLVCLHLAYYLGISFVYRHSAFTEVWEYNGFKLDYDLSRDVLCIAIISLWASILPRRLAVISIANYILLLGIFIPSSVLYTSSAFPFYFWGTTFAALIILFFASWVRLRTRFSRFALLSYPVLAGLCILFSVCTLGAIVHYNGLAHFNLNLTLVYEYRSEAAENLPRWLIYACSWSATVLNPLIALLGLRLRAIWLTPIGVLLGVVLFALTAHKAPVIYPLAAILAYLISYEFLARPRRLLIVATVSVSVLLTFSWRGPSAPLDNEATPRLMENLFLRRIVLVPSLLNSYYLDFFGTAESPFWFFADKAFTFGLLQRPSETSPPYLIGTYYLAEPESGANTGLIGSGFAQAGMIGVLLYTVFFAGFCIVVDSLIARHRLPMLASGFIGVLIICIISSDFFTTLFTHGGLVLLGIFFITREPHQSDSKRLRLSRRPQPMGTT